jgi:hypothetical protein
MWRNRFTATTLLLWAVCSLACSEGSTAADCDDDACGDDGTTTSSGNVVSTRGAGGAGGSGSATGGGQTGAGAGSSMPPDVSQCSEFESITAYFGYLNDTRVNYDSHDRYKGIPWQGAQHNARTFPLQFAWSETLAAQAQQEAERIANGASPSGTHVPGADPFTRDLWIDGINTEAWRIATAEYPGDWEPENFTGNTSAALKNSNGSARLGFFYHDFGGDGPVITQAGLGAAIAADCVVWWVLQLGP